MKSVKTALFWEYWRRHCWWILCFLAGLIGGIIILWYRFHERGFGPGLFFIAHCYILRLEMILFLAMIFFRQFDLRKNRINFPSRLYVLPVRTYYLVANQMIFPALIVAGLYLVTIAAIRLAFSVTLPIFGPLLLMLAFLASMQAIIWLTTGFRFLQFALGLLCYVQFGRLVSMQYGTENIFQLPRTPWEEMGVVKLLALLLCIGVAYGIAVIGISHDRRGDCNGWAGLNAFFAGLSNILPRRSKPFRFATGAQFWLEWRKKGCCAPTVAFTLCLLSVLVGGAGAKSIEITFWLLLLIAILNLGAPFFIGLTMGSMGQGGIMTSFRATRPTSSFTQAMVAFGTAIWSILMAWVVILLASLFAFAWVYLIGQSDVIISMLQGGIALMKEIGYIKILALIGMIPLYFCAAVGIGGTLKMMGRTWLVCALFGGWLGGTIVWAIIGGMGLIPEQIGTSFSLSLPWGIGMICLSGTIWIFVLAHQRGIINTRISFLAGCVWAGLFAGLCIAWRFALVEGVKALWFSRTLNTSSIILMGGLLTLTVLPLASGPLALAWNRHR